MFDQSSNQMAAMNANPAQYNNMMNMNNPMMTQMMAMNQMQQQTQPSPMNNMGAMMNPNQVTESLNFLLEGNFTMCITSQILFILLTVLIIVWRALFLTPPPPLWKMEGGNEKLIINGYFYLF